MYASQLLGSKPNEKSESEALKPKLGNMACKQAGWQHYYEETVWRAWHRRLEVKNSRKVGDECKKYDRLYTKYDSKDPPVMRNITALIKVVTKMQCFHCGYSGMYLFTHSKDYR